MILACYARGRAFHFLEIQSTPCLYHQNGVFYQVLKLQQKFQYNNFDSPQLIISNILIISAYAKIVFTPYNIIFTWFPDMIWSWKLHWGYPLTRWLPTTNILVVIQRIYRYQFKSNYLKKHKFFAAFVLHFWNLH